MLEVTPSTYPISVALTVELIPSFVQSIAAEALMSSLTIELAAIAAEIVTAAAPLKAADTPVTSPERDIVRPV